MPIRCKNCRVSRRKLIAMNNRLMELKSIEKPNKVQLLEMTKIYEDMGSKCKAIEMYNRAKKMNN